VANSGKKCRFVTKFSRFCKPHQVGITCAYALP